MTRNFYSHEFPFSFPFPFPFFLSLSLSPPLSPSPLCHSLSLSHPLWLSANLVGVTVQRRVSLEVQGCEVCITGTSEEMVKVVKGSLLCAVRHNAPLLQQVVADVPANGVKLEVEHNVHVLALRGRGERRFGVKWVERVECVCVSGVWSEWNVASAGATESMR